MHFLICFWKRGVEFLLVIQSDLEERQMATMAVKESENLRVLELLIGNYDIDC